MTSDLLTPAIRRQRLEQFAATLAERRRRMAKAEHKTRGYRDEDGVWRGGLMAFVRYFWHVLEPGTPFIEGMPIEAVCEHLEAVTFGEITNLLINVFPGAMKSMLTDVFWPAWEWGPMELSHLRYVAFSYAASLTERDNGKFRDLILSPDYQAMYCTELPADENGEKPGWFKLRKIGETKVTNNRHGWKLATSVGGVGTGERGDRIILDDPHNVKESESDDVRNETVRWFREAMSSRLNDMEHGAKIIIMQRVHEADVSGTILEMELPYVHLCVPIEYRWDADENGQPYATEIGWVDPRWQPNPEDCEGELAWPERFPPRIIPGMKKEAGPHAWCNPFEAPVLMADLSMKPIGEVDVGDQIVGFELQVGKGRDKKSRLQPATVLSISKNRQPVVKITLESGNVIRCTENHKWYTSRGEGRAAYAAAQEGCRLMRVCDPALPTLNAEFSHEAGWLAGFYDADGSVSMQKRQGERNKTSCLVTFHQGAGRNLPFCEKLERTLTKFGIEFSYKERPNRHKGDRVSNHKVRFYYLKGARLPLYQKLLHTIGVSKWRDRMIESAYGTKWIINRERVVSIESDGEEIVYGLETTTGNYVVWGLASSNSGQYQQTPEARGGGIFKRDFWQPWEPGDGKFPPFSYVVASLDSAYTESEENDPSALTVWGIFEQAGYTRVMLVHAWRKFLEFEGPKITPQAGESGMDLKARAMQSWGLVEWVQHTCMTYKVDRLLIEAKASGISAAQSLRKRYGRQRWSINLMQVKGDKVARAHAVQPAFSQEMVYVPWSTPLRAWVAMVIDEMAVFPRGKHRDLTDSATQAIKHLRDLNILVDDDEARAAKVDDARIEAVRTSRAKLPYNV